MSEIQEYRENGTPVLYAAKIYWDILSLIIKMKFSCSEAEFQRKSVKYVREFSWNEIVKRFFCGNCSQK